MLEELKLGWGLKVCELTCFTKSNLEMPDGELDWALVCFEGEQFAAAHRFSIESQVQGMSYQVTQCRTDTFGDRFRICLLGLFSPFFFFIAFFSLLGSFTYTQVLVQEKGRHYSYRVWSEKWSKLPSFYKSAFCFSFALWSLNTKRSCWTRKCTFYTESDKQQLYIRRVSLVRVRSEGWTTACWCCQTRKCKQGKGRQTFMDILR